MRGECCFHEAPTAPIARTSHRSQDIDHVAPVGEKDRLRWPRSRSVAYLAVLYRRSLSLSLSLSAVLGRADKNELVWLLSAYCSAVDRRKVICSLAPSKTAATSVPFPSPSPSRLGESEEGSVAVLAAVARLAALPRLRAPACWIIRWRCRQYFPRRKSLSPYPHLS